MLWETPLKNDKPKTQRKYFYIIYLTLKKYQEKVRTHNLIRQIIQYKKEPSALTEISPTKVKTNEKHMKGYSTSLATREMQINIIMRPSLTY